MTPETAFLTFSAARFARLDLAKPQDRRELARRASGVHATEAEALAYARREGPAVVMTPDGRIREVARERDAAEDARIAAEQTASAERARWIPCQHRDHTPRLHRSI